MPEVFYLLNKWTEEPGGLTVCGAAKSRTRLSDGCLVSPLSSVGLSFIPAPQMIQGRSLMAKDLLRQSPEQEAPTLGITSCPICPFKGKVWVVYGFFRWLRGKGSVCQCRRCMFDPWVEKIPGWGNGTPLQYSCLESSMDRGAWWAAVNGVTKRHAWATEHAYIS